jgi:hypothetical protein
MPFSNAKKQSILQAAVNATWYIGLSSTSAGSYDLSNDTSGGCAEHTVGNNGYARQAISNTTGWNTATDAEPSVKTNANDIEFPAANGGDWLTGDDIVTAPLFTNPSGGTFIGFCTITSTAKPILDGDVARFAAGSLQLQLT